MASACAWRSPAARATKRRSRPPNEVVQLTEWALGQPPHRPVRSSRSPSTVLGCEARPARGPELLRSADDRDRLLAGRDRAAGPGRAAQPHGEAQFDSSTTEKVKTYARQGYGAMTITVARHLEGRPAGSLVPGAQEVRRHQASSPEGVVGPIFNDEYGDVTGLLYAVKSDGISHAELSDIAEDVKRHRSRPMVKKVDIYGKQAKKIYVEFSHQRWPQPRHHARHDRREPQEPELGPRRWPGRHPRRSRARCG